MECGEESEGMRGGESLVGKGATREWALRRLVMMLAEVELRKTEERGWRSTE